MTINISIPDVEKDLHPQITVLGVGGSGGNAVNNMMNSNLEGVDFLIANTDAQALQISKCKKKIQLGLKSTRGLGSGMRPDIGKQAAEEAVEEISGKLDGSHMVFIAAGMGGGTGTGAAPVIAKLAREKGILTVGVVTKPFHFEGTQRMKLAEEGIEELQKFVDTLLIIPNQNLFRIANEKTTFADAFKMADDVLYAGVRGVTDLMVQPGLINLDFSDVKTVMSEMGKAMMGTGEASGEGRAIAAAEAAIANPLIDDVSLKGAKGLIINITGGDDITLYEVDEAANRIKHEVDENANIIYGTTCDERLDGVVRVSIVATGIEANSFVPSKAFDPATHVTIDNSVYKANIEEKNELKIDNIFSSNLKNEEDLNNNHQIKFNHDEDQINEKHEYVEDLQEDNQVIEESKENNEIEDSMHEDKDSDEEYPQTQEGLENAKNPELNTEGENLSFQASQHLDQTNVQENQTKLEVEFQEDEEKSSLSVRKLSLFDTLENNDSEIENASLNDVKSEPVLEKQDLEEVVAENKDLNQESIISDEKSFDNEDFNQDVQKEDEEELLDIPTFLRRQAN